MSFGDRAVLFQKNSQAINSRNQVEERRTHASEHQSSLRNIILMNTTTSVMILTVAKIAKQKQSYLHPETT